MAELPPPTQVPPSLLSDDAQRWCYHCYTPLSVQTLTDQPHDIICNDCKYGLLDSIATPPPSHESTQYVPSDHSHSVGMRNGERANQSDNQIEERQINNLDVLRRNLLVRDFTNMDRWDQDRTEDAIRHHRRRDGYVIRRSLRVHDFTTVNHWPEILAEDTPQGRRRAPPASKAAIASLNTVELKSEEDCSHCAVCKDPTAVGDFLKELPCRHRYHGDCILPWLGSTNSCPLCRFELETDNPDYQQEKRRRITSSTHA